MTKLTISEAHRATGKARTTIQRAIDNHVLSVEKDDAGVTRIDVSELQRVYGEVNPAAIKKSQRKDAALQVDAPKNEAELELLRVRLEAAERERDEAQRREREERDRHQETREEKARLFDMLEQAQKTIAALPAPNLEPATPTEPAKRGLWARLTGKVS